MKIKKYIYIVIFIVFSLFININELKAADVEVCGYENKISSTKTRYVSIYYNKDNNSWYVKVDGYTSETVVGDLPNLVNSASVFFESNTLINNLIQSGTCPTRAFANANTDAPYVCFDNTQNTSSNENTGFCIGKDSKAFNFEGSVIRDIDYVTQQKNYYNQNVKPYMADCSTFYADDKSGLNAVYKFFGLTVSYDSSGKPIFPSFEESFYPSFMTDFYSTTHAQVKSAIDSCYEQETDDFEAEAAELQDRLNAGEITQNQYDASMEDLEERKDEAEQKYDDFTNYVDSFELNQGDLTVESSCAEILGENLVKLIQILYTIAKIGVPILVIVLSMMDFLKVSTSSDPDKEMKNAFSKTIKRIIIIIIIFIVPLLISSLQLIWPNLDLSCMPK